MSLLDRVVGLGRLEDFFFLNVFLLPFKTEIDTPLPVFLLFGIIKNLREILLSTAYIIKHNVKVG